MCWPRSTTRTSARIYGVEDAGGQPLLVLELVEGEDLADRIRRGALPVAEALALARQIAEALEAAHAQGIVHRDLKPANVKVRSDGTVKVLDFGLAKACVGESASGAANVSMSPTFTATGTAAGIILGTAAYMAPEQARGQAVDKRADIWAFGVLLWEMLTGSRLFAGDTVSDVLAAVLTRAPDWTALPPALPRPVRNLLRRTLERNPKQRLHDIADARLLIDDALGGQGDVSTDAPPLKAPRGHVWTLWLALPAVAAAAVIAGRFTAPAASAPAVRLSIALPPGEQFTSVPAVSRDGRVVVYAAGRPQATSQLYVRTLGDFTARAVDGSVGAVYPFISPDARAVAFFADGKLRRAPLGGGGAIDIAPAPDPWGGTWGRDGQIVYIPGFTAGLWRVAADGGTPEQLTKPDGADGGYAHVFPQSMPEGRDVVFGFWGRSFYTALFSMERRTWREMTPAKATQALFVGVYMASGHVVAGDVSGGVRAAAWTPAAAGPASPETVVLDNVYWQLSIERPWMNVAENGTIVYVRGNPSRRHLVWVDRQGREEQLPGEPDQILRATVSRDGRRVVYDTNQSTEWIIDLQTGARSRIVSGVRSWHGGWLPGDQRIVVSSNKGGNWDLYTVGITGNEGPKALLQTPYAKFVQAVGPDGSVVYMEQHPVTGTDLWMLTPGGRTLPLVVTQYNEFGASLSADGRFAAYQSDETGRPEVYVVPSSGGGPRVAISTEGGAAPVWSRNGRELFYRSGAGSHQRGRADRGSAPRRRAPAHSRRVGVQTLASSANSTLRLTGSGSCSFERNRRRARRGSTWCSTGSTKCAPRSARGKAADVAQGFSPVLLQPVHQVQLREHTGVRICVQTARRRPRGLRRPR